MTPYVSLLEGGHAALPRCRCERHRPRLMSSETALHTLAVSPLLDSEIDANKNKWPEEYSEHRRDDWLGAAEVGEVVVRVRHEEADDDVHKENSPAQDDPPQ